MVLFLIISTIVVPTRFHFSWTRRLREVFINTYYFAHYIRFTYGLKSLNNNKLINKYHPIDLIEFMPNWEFCLRKVIATILAVVVENLWTLIAQKVWFHKICFEPRKMPLNGFVSVTNKQFGRCSLKYLFFKIRNINTCGSCGGRIVPNDQCDYYFCTKSCFDPGSPKSPSDLFFYSPSRKREKVEPLCPHSVPTWRVRDIIIITRALCTV